jgi:thioredoxin reductase (NADPH)
MVTAQELAALPIFADLEPDDLERVAHRCADVHAIAGEYLVHEGELTNFYVLLSGKIELTRRMREIEPVLVIRDTPGDYFGEIPLLLGSAALVNCRAATSSRLASLDPQAFRWLYRCAPAFAQRVSASVYERLAGVQELAADQPPATAIVVGQSRDRACHDLRDFLARNHVPFEFFEIDDPAAAKFIPDFERHRDRCPLVQIYDGPLLEQPTPRELAEALHLATRPAATDYDVAIIGGGPAGLAAAVYGASEGLHTVLFEREALGGQAGTSSRIENYLGFPTGISGDELASRALTQASRFGAELVVTRRVGALEPDGSAHRVVLDGGDSIFARSIVLATGVSWRTLAIEGVDRFVGAGVFYGAARTEALSMSGRDIHLIGGGNSAGQAAMYFANYARTVTLVVRAESLRTSMSDYLIKELETRDNVRYEHSSEVVAAEGHRYLEAVVIRNRQTGTAARHETAGVFVFIGADAETDWLPDEILRDEQGFVLTGLLMRNDARAGWSYRREPYFLETSVPGIFAAGDVRASSVKRCAAGVGEGSMAIALIHQHLGEMQLQVAGGR